MLFTKLYFVNPHECLIECVKMIWHACSYELGIATISFIFDYFIKSLDFVKTQLDEKA